MDDDVTYLRWLQDTHPLKPDEWQRVQHGERQPNTNTIMSAERIDAVNTMCEIILSRQATRPWTCHHRIVQPRHEVQADMAAGDEVCRRLKPEDTSIP